MLAVYIILGLAWSVCMCCSYKDLVRLQFWVFGVVILGFLEKVFFVSEYSSVNAGEQSKAFNCIFVQFVNLLLLLVSIFFDGSSQIYLCLSAASMLIVLAEGISAVKRALARVLLIIVCLGFGTVMSVSLLFSLLFSLPTHTFLLSLFLPTLHLDLLFFYMQFSFHFFISPSPHYPLPLPTL